MASTKMIKDTMTWIIMPINQEFDDFVMLIVISVKSVILIFI